MALTHAHAFMKKKLFIAGVPVNMLTRAEALERCREFLQAVHAPFDKTQGKQYHVVTVNPEMVVEAQRNTAFREVLQKSDLALCDGTGMALATRWLHWVKLERIPGVEFMVHLCRLAEVESASVFFLGGRGGVAEKTAAMLQKKFPRLKIAGSSETVDVIPAQAGIQNDGFRLGGRNDKEGSITNADILFVALGSPKQELWIAENLSKLPSVKIAMGVGGAFDMISGKIKRAPQFLRKLGLEWLWRLLQEPHRYRRIVTATIGFAWLVCGSRTTKTDDPSL